jgi:general secretion pathway protein F
MAMIYPCLLTVVAVIIVIALLTYVVPQVVMVFEQTGQQLPLLTRSLILSSRIMTEYGTVFVVVLGGIIIAGYYSLQKQEIRRTWDLLLLKLPLLGKVILTLNTARLSRTLTILVDSGVPVLEALKIGSRVIRNLSLRQVLDAAFVSVREGGNLHAALGQGRLFPPLFIHLLAAGEDSGALEMMLGRVADHQEKELESALTVAISILEPMIILLMGAVVLFIVLAILTPIFEMNQLVGA